MKKVIKIMIDLLKIVSSIRKLPRHLPHKVLLLILIPGIRIMLHKINKIVETLIRRITLTLLHKTSKEQNQNTTSKANKNSGLNKNNSTRKL